MAAIMGELRPWFTPEAVADMQREAPDLQGLVATGEHDAVLGFLLWHHEGSECEVKWIAVSPSFHRQGVGRRLIDGLVERAQGCGVMHVHVATVAPTVAYEPYARTRRFYESCGFRLAAVEPGGWPDGTDKGTYVMELRRLPPRP
jgi:ribosomal protein S18 acetylase RimI-like enzyme